MASVRKRLTADGSRCYDVVYRDLDRRQCWKTHRGRSTPTRSRPRWRPTTSSTAGTSTGGDRPGPTGKLADGADARPEHQGSRHGRFRRPRRRPTPDGIGPHDRGLSREHIMASIDASSTGGHRPRRPVPVPPVELRDTDRGDHAGLARDSAGRQRAPHGASSMYAWQFAKARHIAGTPGPGSRRC